jgi:hypothetical protein
MPRDKEPTTKRIGWFRDHQFGQRDIRSQSHSPPGSADFKGRLSMAESTQSPEPIPLSSPEGLEMLQMLKRGWPQMEARAHHRMLLNLQADLRNLVPPGAIVVDKETSEEGMSIEEGPWRAISRIIGLPYDNRNPPAIATIFWEAKAWAARKLIEEEVRWKVGKEARTGELLAASLVEHQPTPAVMASAPGSPAGDSPPDSTAPSIPMGASTLASTANPAAVAAVDTGDVMAEGKWNQIAFTKGAVAKVIGCRTEELPKMLGDGNYVAPSRQRFFVCYTNINSEWAKALQSLEASMLAQRQATAAAKSAAKDKK